MHGDDNTAETLSFAMITDGAISNEYILELSFSFDSSLPQASRQPLTVSDLAVYCVDASNITVCVPTENISVVIN